MLLGDVHEGHAVVVLVVVALLRRESEPAVRPSESAREGLAGCVPALVAAASVLRRAHFAAAVDGADEATVMPALVEGPVAEARQDDLAGTHAAAVDTVPVPTGHYQSAHDLYTLDILPPRHHHRTHARRRSPHRHRPRHRLRHRRRRCRRRWTNAWGGPTRTDGVVLVDELIDEIVDGGVLPAVVCCPPR